MTLRQRQEFGAFGSQCTTPFCYHYQQCVEKYQKAVLLHFGEVVPKIHDLQKLGRLLVPHIPEMQELLPDLERLTDIALEVRYPGFSADREEANEARSVCEKARRLCIEILQ